MAGNSKDHWENIYKTKQPHEVSWTQIKPETSLGFIQEAKLEKNAAIIDVGGGDSNLVDFLLQEGYENITVLDISAAALERAKERLGDRSNKVTWVVADISEYRPRDKFDFWHDRAAFHFLTKKEAIRKYEGLVGKYVAGYITIGTFSENGPGKCSGLEIKQYSQEALTAEFSDNFEKVKCIEEDHTTPFGTIQSFTFCCFKKQTV